MWHDAWPLQPPGGHRPPDAPPFTSPGDQLLAVGVGATAGAGALAWASGQLAGLAFGHTWLELDPAEVARVLVQLRHQGSADLPPSAPEGGTNGFPNLSGGRLF